MTEIVVRHRNGGRDKNSAWLPGSDAELVAFAVAPSGGSDFVAREREGEQVACAVYFIDPVDIVSSDELTVRGERFQVTVNVWRSPWTNRGGVEVLCKRGQG